MSNKLLSEIKIDKIGSFQNRVVMSAMTRGFADKNHCATSDILNYYESRAKNNLGLIITEGIIIHPSADGYNNVPHLFTDQQISNVAQKITVSNSAAIVHISGSLTLDPLSQHERIASCHPLLSLPDSSLGEKRLLDEAWFAVAGDPISIEIVRAFDDHLFHYLYI